MGLGRCFGLSSRWAFAGAASRALDSKPDGGACR
jgi:hypothetical protein